MPLDEYMRDFNDDLIYDTDRSLKSAPAQVYGANAMDFGSNLFTSKDLVLVSRTSKTAPQMIAKSTDMTPYFPEISWMVNSQNRRIADLLKFTPEELKSNSLKSEYSQREMNEQKINFDNDIVEITKLIEMSKRLVAGNLEAKLSQSMLYLNISNKSQSSAGRSLLASTQKDDGHSRTAKPRKSVREIIETVARKIKVLKSDPIEFNLLKNKIAEYKNKNRKIKSAPSRQEAYEIYSPSERLKLIKKWREQHESHRHYVLQRKKKMDKELLIKKRLEIQRKNEAAAINQKAHESAGRFQLIQKKWFIMIVLASRIALIQKTVTEARKNKEIFIKKRHAAIVIQRFYRRYRNRKLMILMQQSFAIIRPVFKRYIDRVRHQKKHNAADMIRTFFKEVHDTSKLMKIVKKYRYAVIKAQHYARSFLAVNKARMVVLMKYADKLETQWKAIQRKSLLKSSDDLKKSMIAMDDNKKKGSKKINNSVRKEKKEIGINLPSELKFNAIRLDLTIRLKQYRTKCNEYKLALENYNKSLKKRLYTQGNDDGPPSKPIFKDLLKDIMSMKLDCGSVSFHSDIIIHFERERLNDNIILTLDKIKLKRTLSVDDTLNKKVKVITDSEKMDIMNAIQLLNSEKIPSKVVITRTVYKEYTFIESIYYSLKELLFKVNK